MVVSVCGMAWSDKVSRGACTEATAQAARQRRFREVKQDPVALLKSCAKKGEMEVSDYG